MTTARDVIAEAMMQSMFAPHELPLSADLRERYLATADAVIEAQLSAPNSVRLELAALLNPWRPAPWPEDTDVYVSENRCWWRYVLPGEPPKQDSRAAGIEIEG